MSCPFNEEQLLQLKAFVDLCKTHPQILQHPKLSFFKDYLVSLGVTIPTVNYESTNFSASGDSKPSSANTEAKAPETPEEESEESDVELDMEGVIPDNSEANQEMGDESKEVTDEASDQSDEKRSQAMKAFSEQQFDEAISLYTEAIQLNPHSALLFAKRGQVFLKQNKLRACIKDCTRALELNCDSAAAYKFRGRAYRLLGMFEEASHDLCESLKIDYDDQANEWLSEVKPNSEKIRQHKLSVQRKKEEKEHQDKLNRARKAQEERAKAAQEQANFGPSMPGGESDPLDFIKLCSDPELRSIISDPEVFNAFYDVSANPANFVKYQNNPKVLAAFQLMSSKFNTPGGIFSGFGGGAPQPSAEEKVSGDDDVGLD